MLHRSRSDNENIISTVYIIPGWWDSCRATMRKWEKILDVEGFEPSTSRMQSVRATTVPNAHVETAIQIQ